MKEQEELNIPDNTDEPERLTGADWWNNEKAKLQEDKDFWQVPEGQHTIRFTTEADSSRTFEREYDGRIVYKQLFDIEVLEKENWVSYLWSISKGKTKNSTYGQLVILGAAKQGLVGHEIKLIVVGTGKNRRITIPEALEI